MRPRTLLGTVAPVVALAALSTAATGCSDEDPTPPLGQVGAEKRLVVLFTSDEHSHLFSFSPEADDFPTATEPGKGDLVGGAARRASVIKRAREEAAAAGHDSLLVSAGDNQMGCLPHIAFQTRSVDYGTMAALGYDVTTFGNHEFDFGPEALANSIKAAQKGQGLPPIVASNIKFSGGEGDVDLAALYSEDVDDDAPVHPYRLITTPGGIKVGVVGVVGANAERVAPLKTPVAFSAKGLPKEQEGDAAKVLPKLYADLQPRVDKLRNELGADMIILLSHSGISDLTSQAGIEVGEDYQICKNVPGIDFIVSGHAHQTSTEPIVVENERGKCLVLQGGSFGRQIGHVEFVIPSDRKKPVTWVEDTQGALTVDDTTVPDPDLAGSLDGLVAEIEMKSGAGTSYIEDLLSKATGQAVTDDPKKAGDLYFYKVGHTDFDVTDDLSILYLSADSMVAAADAWGAANGKTVDIGLESAGVVRSGLKKGKTGDIALADAFNVVPLGISAADATIGYPLIRAGISLLELRGVLEFSFTNGPTREDFRLAASGIKVEYDPSREPVKNTTDLVAGQKGFVMKIFLDTDHSDGLEQYDTLIYDREAKVAVERTYMVATSSYIAEFASDVGVTLKDDAGAATTIAASVLHRADGSEIKQLEAFVGFLHASPGGKLSRLYDATSEERSRRLTCIGNGC